MLSVLCTKNDLSNQQNQKAILFTQVETIHLSPLLKTKSKSCTFQTDPCDPLPGHYVTLNWSRDHPWQPFWNSFLTTTNFYRPMQNTQNHINIPKSMQCNPVNHCLIPLSSLGPNRLPFWNCNPFTPQSNFPRPSKQWAPSWKFWQFATALTNRLNKSTNTHNQTPSLMYFIK